MDQHWIAERNIIADAFYYYLLGFWHSSKMQYVCRMLVIYFRNDSAILRKQEQGYSLQVISAKLGILVNFTNHQYLGLETKIDKSKTTLFSQTFENAVNKQPLFLAFRPRQWRLGLLTSLLKSSVSKISVQ